MGGTVTVIIKNKGKIHKMARWTNSLPFYIKNNKFFNEDETHLQKYLSEWTDMKKDYDKNKDSGNFKFNMTPVYIPQSGVIAPTEYGIVYIDYDKNILLSCQGYTDLSSFSLFHVSLSFDYLKEGDKNHKEEFNNFLDLQPRFKSMYYHNKFGKKSKSKYNHLLKSKDLSQDFESLRRNTQKGATFFRSMIEIDTLPFVFKNYPDNKNGFNDIYKEIKKHVVLNRKEENLWKKYLKKRFEE